MIVGTVALTGGEVCAGAYVAYSEVCSASAVTAPKGSLGPEVYVLAL